MHVVYIEMHTVCMRASVRKLHYKIGGGWQRHAARVPYLHFFNSPSITLCVED